MWCEDAGECVPGDCVLSNEYKEKGEDLKCPKCGMRSHVLYCFDDLAMDWHFVKPSYCPYCGEKVHDA